VKKAGIETAPRVIRSFFPVGEDTPPRPAKQSPSPFLPRATVKITGITKAAASRAWSTGTISTRAGDARQHAPPQARVDRAGTDPSRIIKGSGCRATWARASSPSWGSAS